MKKIGCDVRYVYFLPAVNITVAFFNFKTPEQARRGLVCKMIVNWAVNWSGTIL
jgi:hypothetical protein